MAAPIVVPFNNQPINTGVTTASYTVPAGKYSRVIVSIGLSAQFSKTPTSNETTGANSQTGSYMSTPASFNDKLELWLKAGDVLAFTTTTASGTITVPSTTLAASGQLLRVAQSSTSASITLNASSLATFYATSQVSFQQSPGTGVTSTILTLGAFGGTATVVTHFEEFNVIS